MRKAFAGLLLLTIMPIANAADSGGSAPAPQSSQMPTPAKSSQTPTPASSPATTAGAATKNLNTELSVIRGLIANKNFVAALAQLKIADKSFPNNADINNLLGYTSRNLKQYKPAATYYAKALKIDPNHLGALEYQGELFMLTKKTSEAKKNLAKLKNLCGLNCEEYLDLKKAIGNR